MRCINIMELKLARSVVGTAGSFKMGLRGPRKKGVLKPVKGSMLSLPKPRNPRRVAVIDGERSRVSTSLSTETVSHALRGAQPLLFSVKTLFGTLIAPPLLKRGTGLGLPLGHGDIMTMEGHFQMARPRRSPEDRIQRSR